MKTWFDWMDTYYTPRPQPEGAQEGETERILALARQKLGLAGDAPQAQPAPGRARPPGGFAGFGHWRLPPRCCSAWGWELRRLPACSPGHPSGTFSGPAASSRPPAWGCRGKGFP